ncbi:hypothetical protein GCM10027088_14330 [Nocardia goodfellowii]|uniref:Uncharacterized protein n=1 Tax=Nocardia goodfellowii TaxID=882446 RepID=A0ABS4QDL0_9NOCA|nr:hypothetical protein [Nocardia goodfellowii]
MTRRPNAIGFLNTELCGNQLHLHQQLIRAVASVDGTDFCGFVLHNPAADEQPRPLERLRTMWNNLGEPIIYVPGTIHFSGLPLSSVLRARLRVADPSVLDLEWESASADQRNVDAAVQRWRHHRFASHDKSNPAHSEDRSERETPEGDGSPPLRRAVSNWPVTDHTREAE